MSVGLADIALIAVAVVLIWAKIDGWG